MDDADFLGLPEWFSRVACTQRRVMVMETTGRPNIEQFATAGCELSSPPELFALLFVETKGAPCQTGCAYFRYGECLAFKQLFPYVKVEKPRVYRRAPGVTGYARPTKKPFKW